VTIEIHAPEAADSRPYVHGLRVDGKATQKNWVALPEHGTLRLDFSLAAEPDTSWGTAPEDAPPSYSEGRVNFPQATGAAMELPSRSLAVAPGSAGSLRLDILAAEDGGAQRVKWRAVAPAGLSVRPDFGTALNDAGETQAIPLSVSAADSLATGYYDIWFEGTAANGARIDPVMAAIRVARAGEAIPLAYVLNFRGNSVTPIDLSTEAAGAPIAVGREPEAAVVSPDGRRVYVADQGDGVMSVIDAAKDVVTARVKAGRELTGIGISPDGRTIWVADGSAGSVRPIDASTLELGEPVGVGRFPVGVVMAKDGTMLYSVDRRSDTVTPVNLHTRTAEVPIAVGPQPNGAVITADGKRLYVTESGSNSVTVIELPSRKVLATIPVGIRPRAIAISPDSRTVWVANSATDTIMPISTATDQAGSPIVVGGHPAGIVFSGNGRKAFVAILEDNACVPVDLASRSVGKPIRVGDVPVSIAALEPGAH
ncbi:MAG: beta-propeller fold lactonase family protein, partial [Acidobacteriota bacterium]|nr:beta-propeller fold lactonase family protein [Acidobacteriota bacterium]